MQMDKTVHLVAKLKGVHLCKHELGQEVLVVFSIIRKVRWVPCAHLEQQESICMYKKYSEGDLSPSAGMVRLVEASLQIELAVGDGETPLPDHRGHCHIHQLPMVETGTVQVQLPEQ